MFFILADKFLWPVILFFLEKTGRINQAESFGLKVGTHVLQAVESIKTYPDYEGLGDK